MTEQERLSAAIPPLLDWFGKNARVLPWRSDPTPYHVWVSEVMLQQTRVSAVLDYFRRFNEALPDVSALAECEEDALLKLWQGLGYYSRARNLQKAARVVMAEYGGAFPADYQRLLALPGVGEYTAGAIASIAFGLPEPAVDGNVLRVVTRLLACKSDITRPETKKTLRALLAGVMPAECPSTFNQSLMELGALVCVPNGEPHCGECPWNPLCLARQENLIDRIPVKAPKKARRIEELTVFLIVNHGRLALRRRPENGLLAGLWEFPNEKKGTFLPPVWGILPSSVEAAGVGKHIFTHIEWHMSAFIIRTETSALPEGWVWADREELETRYAVPNAFSAFRNQAKALLKEEPQ